jgi:hypothetical protein
LRVERDRRGGLRVFPGQSLERAAVSPTPPQAEPAAAGDSEVLAVAPAETIISAEIEAIDAEPIPIDATDTTAELLGRAKPRRPRARTLAATPGARSSRKTAGRKPAGRRTAARKPSRAEGNDEVDG